MVGFLVGLIFGVLMCAFLVGYLYVCNGMKLKWKLPKGK